MPRQSSRARIAEAYVQVVPVIGDVTQQLERQIVAGVEDATPAAASAGANLGQQVGQQGGDTAASAMGSRIMAGIAALGLGAVLAKAIESGMERFDLDNKLVASLALSDAEAERVTEAASNVYKQGFGESYEAVAEAMKGIVGTVKNGREASAAELEAMAKDVLNMSTVFGVESNEINKAVNGLMGSGFAGSWEESVSIITAGFQTLGESGDDWMDTLSEYSGDFKALGFTGEQSLNLVNSALEAGLMNTDFLADAMRELGIKLRSGEAADSLQILGFDPEKIKADVEAGGEVAQATVLEVLQRLRDSGDSQLWAGIIGTQAEDFNNAFKTMDLSVQTINGSLGEGIGDMELLGETINSGPAASLETFKRVGEEAFMQVLIPALEAVTPLLQGFSTWLSENEGLAQVLAVSAGVILVGGVVLLTAALWGMAAAGFAAMVPMLPMIGIIAAVVAAIAVLSLVVVQVYENWDTLSAWFVQLFEGFMGWIGTLGEGIANFFGSIGKGIVNMVIDGLNILVWLVNQVIGLMNSINPINWFTNGALNIPNIPNIPRYAKGGVVEAKPGGQLLIAGEAGRNEAIVDEGNLNSLIMGVLSGNFGNNNAPTAQNVSFTINQQPGESSKELVERMQDELLFTSLKPTEGFW